MPFPILFALAAEWTLDRLVPSRRRQRPQDALDTRVRRATEAAHGLARTPIGAAPPGRRVKLVGRLRARSAVPETALSGRPAARFLIWQPGTERGFESGAAELFLEDDSGTIALDLSHPLVAPSTHAEYPASPTLRGFLAMRGETAIPGGMWGEARIDCDALVAVVGVIRGESDPPGVALHGPGAGRGVLSGSAEQPLVLSDRAELL